MTQNHLQQPLNVTLKLQQIENNIQTYAAARSATQGRLETYREQYARVGEEIKALGVNPQSIEAELMALAQEIIDKTQQLDELLPTQLIEQMQRDLNQPIQAPI